MLKLIRAKDFHSKTASTLTRLLFSAVITPSVEKRQWFNLEIMQLLFTIKWKLALGNSQRNLNGRDSSTRIWRSVVLSLRWGRKLTRVLINLIFVAWDMPIRMFCPFKKPGVSCVWHKQTDKMCLASLCSGGQKTFVCAHQKVNRVALSRRFSI